MWWRKVDIFNTRCDNANCDMNINDVGLIGLKCSFNPIRLQTTNVINCTYHGLSDLYILHDVATRFAWREIRSDYFIAMFFFPQSTSVKNNSKNLSIWQKLGGLTFSTRSVNNFTLSLTYLLDVLPLWSGNMITRRWTMNVSITSSSFPLREAWGGRGRGNAVLHLFLERGLITIFSILPKSM